MISRAIARYIRISPRKTRKVIDLIRGLPVVKAEAILGTINKRPALYVKRLITSAIDSANKKSNLLPADLYISSIKADGGPMLKRHRAASMGRGTMIKHRTTHITLELDKIKIAEKKLTVADKDTAKKSKKREIKKVTAKRKKSK